MTECHWCLLICLFGEFSLVSNNTNIIISPTCLKCFSKCIIIVNCRFWWVLASILIHIKTCINKLIHLLLYNMYQVLFNHISEDHYRMHTLSEFNSFLASCNLLSADSFANILDLDYVKPDLDPKCLTILMVFLKDFFQIFVKK